MNSQPPVISCASCAPYTTRVSSRDGTPVVSVTNRPPQFGVFFDGTGNNLQNDARDPRDDNEPTNIAKLFLIYPKSTQYLTDKHYIEGVGTRAGEENSKKDMAFALSFEARLREALSSTQKFFRTHPKAPVGILDVFGFSRGAAAARAFVNEVHRIGKADPRFWGGPHLAIRFLGIFDTVGSINMPGDNDNDPYILDLHPKAVEYVYHLTARHEQREYFPLSSILTRPNSPPYSTFVEEEIPGAHADVGGGYGPLPQKILFPHEQIYWLSNAQREEELHKLKLRYEELYYQPGINLTMRVLYNASNGPPGSPYRRSLVAPHWIRHVRPHIAHSALQKMHARAISKGVPFEPLANLLTKPVFSGRASEDVYAIPADLTVLLTKGGHDELYTRYVHHSHQYRTDDPINPVNSNKPEADPILLAPNGHREIFYNNVARALLPSVQWRRIVTLTGNGQERTEWVRT